MLCLWRVNTAVLLGGPGFAGRLEGGCGFVKLTELWVVIGRCSA